LTVATVPVRALLQRLSTPGFQAELEKYAAIPLLREGWRAISILPALINAERQALGLSTSEIVIEDRRVVADPVADAIVSDPDAMDAAILLLDRAAAKDKASD
jgi:hypothetical protein